MKFLPSALLFIGYLLVYAAFASSGKFATQPWKGVTSDAYTDTGGVLGGVAGGAAGAVSTTPPPATKRPGRTRPGGQPTTPAGQPGTVLV